MIKGIGVMGLVGEGVEGEIVEVVINLVEEGEDFLIGVVGIKKINLG